MARGWESKSVEQQQAEMGDQPKSSRRPLSSAQQKVNRKREGLLLSRTSLVRQLELATQARHRRMLEQAVAEIDRQLADCEQDNQTSCT
jgi:chorismate-pyruvate lyase